MHARNCMTVSDFFRKTFLGALILVATIVSACGTQVSATTTTSVPTQAVAASATPQPMASKIPTSSATASPTPTATPSTSPTNEPSPTIELSATPEPDGPFVPFVFLEQIEEPMKRAFGEFEWQLQPIGGRGNPDGYRLTFMVYDLWIGDIPLTTTSGEVVATSKVTIIACYLKPDGKVEWILIPFYMRNSAGQLIIFTDTVAPNQVEDEELPEAAQWDRDHGWSRGSIRWAEISANPSQAYQNQSYLIEAWSVTGSIAIAYARNRESKIETFITSGDSGGNMVVFPLYIDRNSSSAGTVSLP